MVSYIYSGEFGLRMKYPLTSELVNKTRLQISTLSTIVKCFMYQRKFLPRSLVLFDEADINSKDPDIYHKVSSSSNIVSYMLLKHLQFFCL